MYRFKLLLLAFLILTFTVGIASANNLGIFDIGTKQAIRALADDEYIAKRSDIIPNVLAVIGLGMAGAFLNFMFILTKTFKKIEDNMIMYVNPSAHTEVPQKPEPVIEPKKKLEVGPQ